MTINLTQPEHSQPLTVLQMLPELDGGGVERGTLEIGRFLVAHGHRSLVVSAGGRLVPQLEGEGSIHFSMATGRKSLTSLQYLLPLRRLMQSEKVDVLHLRSRMPAWIGYLAWKSLPKKERPVLVTTFHGFYSVNGYSAIMTKGDVVIAVSDAVRKHIAERYGRTENVITIHRGVDGGSFSPSHVAENRLEVLRRQWDIDPDKVCIMLPGRFTRWKGQAVFLESLGMVQHTNFQAILVGDPRENEKYAAELREIIRINNLGAKVKMVGHCQDMPAAYLLADLVVSASSDQPEAFGRVAVEGMAMAKPVIATAHGGSLETVVAGETGWLVKPGSGEDMAAAIDAALKLSGRERAGMGARGQDRVKSMFTTEAMCRTTLALYMHLAQEKSSA